MSTGAEHYAEAEKLLTIADQPDYYNLTTAQASELAHRAHAHATLALAAATATHTVIVAVEVEEDRVRRDRPRLDEVTRQEISGWDEALGGVIDDE